MDITLSFTSLTRVNKNTIQTPFWTLFQSTLSYALTHFCQTVLINVKWCLSRGVIPFLCHLWNCNCAFPAGVYVVTRAWQDKFGLQETSILVFSWHYCWFCMVYFNIEIFVPFCLLFCMISLFIRVLFFRLNK